MLIVEVLIKSLIAVMVFNVYVDVNAGLFCKCNGSCCKVI